MKHGKRRRTATALVVGMTALTTAALAMEAVATPIRFDNPPGGGHYEWPATLGDETRWLDVMFPASSQPAVPDDPTALQQLRPTDTESRVRGVTGGAEVEEGGLWGMHLVPLEAGDLIPSGASWDNAAFIYYEGYPDLPEGQPMYIGMRFDPGDGLHYGWVGVVRYGFDLDAFAWGYETEVGVPIGAGAPEPGTLTVLAIGAVALAARRSRSSN